jgi:hypothetical protein
MKEPIIDSSECLANFIETFNKIKGDAPVDLKILGEYVSVPCNPF